MTGMKVIYKQKQNKNKAKQKTHTHTHTHTHTQNNQKTQRKRKEKQTEVQTNKLTKQAKKPTLTFLRIKSSNRRNAEIHHKNIKEHYCTREASYYFSTNKSSSILLFSLLYFLKLNLLFWKEINSALQIHKKRSKTT